MLMVTDTITMQQKSQVMIKKHKQNTKLLIVFNLIFNITNFQQTLLDCSKSACKKSIMYCWPNISSLIFSAEHGKQRSASTTSFPADVSEAVFRSNSPPAPKNAPELHLSLRWQERLGRERNGWQRILFQAKNQ